MKYFHINKPQKNLVYMMSLTHDPEDGFSLEGACVNLLAFNIGGHGVLSNKNKNNFFCIGKEGAG